VPNIVYSYAQASQTNYTSLTKSDQDKTNISTLFSGDLNMGIFSSNNQPKDNDILQFLYDHVSDPSNKHVINDLIVGNRSTSGDTVSVTVSAKPASAEYQGSVNVTYQIRSGVDLASVIIQKILYDNATSSQ
jgi:hypothetical protein